MQLQLDVRIFSHMIGYSPFQMNHNAQFLILTYTIMESGVVSRTERTFTNPKETSAMAVLSRETVCAVRDKTG